MRVCSGKHYTPREEWEPKAERLLLAGFSVNEIARKVGLTNSNPIRNWLHGERPELLSIARDNGKQRQAASHKGVV